LTALHFVGPWDLDRRLACVPEDPAAGPVLLVESVAKGAALPWHRKKLVLVLSAMRHFADELRSEGYTVDLRRAPSYVEGIRAAAVEHRAERVVALEPREWGLHQALTSADLGVPLELRPDGGPGGHFLLPREEFLSWAEGRKTLRMDAFYRWMRQRTGILLDPRGKPLGGKWSLDQENRKRIPKDVAPPAFPGFGPDAITRGAMEQVAKWPGLWGEAAGFDWPVTRADALALLEDFVEHRLPRFGDYQDAMRTGEPFLWHAGISAAMNLSLLHPMEVVDRVLGAFEAGQAPLNATEGFVRQVIGWREFVRGVYWLRMPGMRSANALGAERPLPAFFWDPSRTDMACVRESVEAVLEHGYAHHIQRLMVLGNFALLAGLRPLDVSHWFWAGFVDAYEWVELPNVHGMALYADDGFTTKPYAASGAYIDRMSDHCKGCRYQVKTKVGPDACPFNVLFWDFMARHRDRLSKNPRLRTLLSGWDRRDPQVRQAIRSDAAAFLEALEPADTGWRFLDDAC
jgi:deoxyribodipyrimidine photolyase-related protein